MSADRDEAIKNTVEEIWKKYDKDSSGFLELGEAREFIRATLFEMD
jgi:hypothetical protein